MMKSEFIERTRFEPTAAEYEEIEQEYMGCDIDKDVFCKQWLKGGGIQRLSRLRVRRIEELENEVQQRAKEYGELDRIRCEQVTREQEKYKALLEEKRRQEAETDKFVKLLNEESAVRIEAERKLAVLKEAFEILRGEDR